MATHCPRTVLTSDDEIRDQVILPSGIAFAICLRGIKTRLGRSTVTLLGVTLGIMFLMSVLSGFHIKSAMSKEAGERLVVDRRISMLRNEVGSLAGKRLEVWVGTVEPDGVRFVRALAAEHEASVHLVGRSDATSAILPPGMSEGEGADAVIAIGDLGRMPDLDGALRKLEGTPLLSIAVLSDEIRARIQACGVRTKALDVELRDEEKREAAQREAEARSRMVWIATAALLITVMGIANAMLMSVTERIREIGTMKCLGALSGFIVKLFLIESSLLGAVGSAIGALAGVVFSMFTYSYSFGLTQVMTSVSYRLLFLYGVGCVGAGIVLAIAAAIYPARVAAKMVPAAALTTNV